MNVVPSASRMASSTDRSLSIPASNSLQARCLRLLTVSADCDRLLTIALSDHDFGTDTVVADGLKVCDLHLLRTIREVVSLPVRSVGDWRTKYDAIFAHQGILVEEPELLEYVVFHLLSDFDNLVGVAIPSN